MRRPHFSIFLLSLCILSIFMCTACSAFRGADRTNKNHEGETARASESKNGAGPQSTPKETTIESTIPTDKGSLPIDGDSRSGEMLTAQAIALCGLYFKEGDFTYRLEITPGESDDPGLLNLAVCERETLYPVRSNAYRELQKFRLRFEDNCVSYRLDRSGNAPVSAKINHDGTIILSGGAKISGTYYSFRDYLLLPGAFERPLNDTDLIGLDRDEMQLLRNQFYAVYGRKFQSEHLKDYFESRPWYVGSIEPGEFDEGILGGLFRRNIAFLKAAEESYEKNQAERVAKAYAQLQPAPYLSLLPEHGEVSVNLPSGAGQAEDRGLFYSVVGTISLPISITADQYGELEAGQSVTLQAAAPDGEDASLQRSGDHSHANGDASGIPSGYTLTSAGGGWEEEVFLSYEPYSMTYTLWRNSSDTLFRQVYEGDIYVLKGACEEYAGYFDMAAESRGESPGNFRIMDFDVEKSGETESAALGGPESYQGNILVTDQNGYVKALYFLGD